MNIVLDIVNYGCALFFGIVLSLQFSNIPFYKNKGKYIITLVLFGILQILYYLVMGEQFMYRSYPILVHLPLFLLIRFVFDKNTYISSIAVFSAYLFCTPRKWIGTLVSGIWDYNPMASQLTQILITLPLLYLIIKLIVPYIVRLKYESKIILKMFLILPLVYYVLEYIFTVYTDLLYTGGAIIVEFIDTTIVLLYFAFSVFSLYILSEKKRVDEENMLFSLMSSQSKRELEQLRQSQIQSAIHCHDLRHHLTFLSTCISENRLDEAQDYIRQTCEDVASTVVQHYSENKTINLIISSYVNKAKEHNIKTEINITAIDFSRFQNTDLCSLLANGFENAIHASSAIEDTEFRYIKLRMFEKSHHLCLDLRNSYSLEPIFENNIPISQKSGHGVGVKSMLYVVEKYEGVYGFSAKDGEFSFQVSM